MPIFGGTMKYIPLFFFLIITTVGLIGLNKKDTGLYNVEETSFDPNLCQNGFAGSWSGACICFKGYTGRYCDSRTSLFSMSSATPPQQIIFF